MYYNKLKVQQLLSRRLRCKSHLLYNMQQTEIGLSLWIHEIRMAYVSTNCLNSDKSITYAHCLGCVHLFARSGLVCSTDLYIYIVDTVPPVHVVWNHVATDKLTTANNGTLLRAQPVSVSNHVQARRSLIERSVTWLATESDWARNKLSAICSGKLCGFFIILFSAAPVVCSITTFGELCGRVDKRQPSYDASSLPDIVHTMCSVRRYCGSSAKRHRHLLTDDSDISLRHRAGLGRRPLPHGSLRIWTMWVTNKFNLIQPASVNRSSDEQWRH